MSPLPEESDRPPDRSLWDDEKLVEAAKRGDREAFDELYRRYEPMVRQCVQKHMPDPDEAEDITQEAFVKAFRALPLFRGEAKFTTWLVQIAHNLCVSRARKERAHHESASLDFAEAEEGMEPPSLQEEGPDELVERREMHRLVRFALSSLPHHHRFPIVLRDLDGRSYREIAEILHCTVPIVKARLHRARNALRNRVLRYLGWRKWGNEAGGTAPRR